MEKRYNKNACERKIQRLYKRWISASDPAEKESEFCRIIQLCEEMRLYEMANKYNTIKTKAQLYSVGREAVFNALCGYDPKKGKLISRIVYKIRLGLKKKKREIQNLNNFIGKIPDRVLDTYNRVLYYIIEYENKNNGDININEIKEISEKDYKIYSNVSKLMRIIEDADTDIMETILDYDNNYITIDNLGTAKVDGEDFLLHLKIFNEYRNKHKSFSYLAAKYNIPKEEIRKSIKNFENYSQKLKK